MQNPNQGRNNNPNQNQWNPPNQYDQDPYRQGAMNNPEQDPYRQGNMPDRSAAPMGNTMQNVPTTRYTVPEGYPFTEQEWQTLLATPLQVSMAMMSVSPSGIIGVIQEAMAVGRSVQALQHQGNVTPMIGQLGQQLTQVIDDFRAGRPSPVGDIRQMMQPDVARNIALSNCQQVTNILAKVSPQDANAYKQFVYTLAYNVAAAGREGGFLGLFGGEQISPPEQNMLSEIASVLRVQRS
ncbi:hypothetical protein KDA_58720 [Dictyobacter alpinus]|uniref:Uncharacterized protein n=1 Tax=Dictyobacter alpinus TaxID=2014873 RepID=A0A402BG51_9CHLR|nr:hypothetical protein [Dictyobacter alpinus]GCE30388.1 hypothetical protein KDA_58720 [Dictyobacter alpinus]